MAFPFAPISSEMNPYQNVHADVLRATSRVFAALKVIPHLVGPKEVWAPWMARELAEELVQVPEPTIDSPYPKLLGNLCDMLYHYFGRGMTVDMLDFTGVQTQSYDSSGVEYIDFPLDELPEPMGDDLWWKVLPSSVSLRVTPPPPASSHMTQESLDPRKQPPSPSPDVVIVTAPDTIMRPKRKRTAMSGGPKRAKRRIFESSEDESSEDENNVQAEPSTQSRGKDNVDAPIPKVCDNCKTRGSVCVWPTSTELGSSRNERRACTACVTQKTRCCIAGVFSIRRPRGKKATQQQDSEVDTLMERFDEICARILDLEKKLAINDEERRLLEERISELEGHVRQLKR